MERRSFGWVWAGIGLVAVVILIATGVGRRPRLELTPPPTQPIIVEPIQPNATTPAVTEVTGPSLVTPATRETQQRLPPEEAAPRPSGQPQPPEGAERVRTIQEALHAAGFNPGPIDGKMGRLTQQAIREFQEAQGLSVDGKVGPRTWARLEPFLRTAKNTATTHD